jgi:photosystem II PsbZ protein
MLNWEKSMLVILFNLLLAVFVVLSFIMIVAVPVALASPQNWDQSKRLILLGSGAWGVLVVLVGTLNFAVV